MVRRVKLNALVERLAARILRETEYSKTIPAAKSKDELEAEKELSGKLTRNPKAKPMSQSSIKINAIKKELDKLGYTDSTERAKHVTQHLGDWYDSLDPSDALVSTAADLASRFVKEN